MRLTAALILAAAAGLSTGAWMKSASMHRAERAVVRKSKIGASGPVIYYHFDSELDSKKEVRECILQSMAQISNASCIRFVNSWEDKPPKDHPFIIFVMNLQPKKCSAEIGLDMRRQIFIRLGEKCGVETGRCAHELMKALGFEPEHERPDRDEFLRVHLANVKQGEEVEFTKSPKASNVELLTPYDLSSIMHPNPLDLSGSGSPTVGAVDGLLAESVGWATRRPSALLSHRDKAALNAVFKCPVQCTAELDCGHGGYVDAACRCVCPYGFTGRTCAELSKSHHFNLDGCGVVKADASGHIASPKYPHRYQHGLYCQWLLETEQPWQRLEFEIVDLDLEHEEVVPPDTCHDRLFIRPHGTDVVTKSVSCLPSEASLLVGSRHRTQYPWLLVEFRSYHWGSFDHRGFNISYRVVGQPPRKPQEMESAGMVSDGGSEALHCYACQSMQECNRTTGALKTELCKPDHACGRTTNDVGAIEWRGCLSVGKCRREKRSCRTGEACVSCCMRGYCNSAVGLSVFPLLLLLPTLLLRR